MIALLPALSPPGDRPFWECRLFTGYCFTTRFVANSSCFQAFFAFHHPVMPITVLATFRDTFVMSLFLSPYVLSARIP
jgi:hypothetical protein